MLSKRYRVAAENDSGSALTDIQVYVAPWNFDSDGKLKYEAEDFLAWAVSPGNGAGVVPPDGYIDNSEVLAQGAHCLAVVEGGGTGDVHFYLQLYTDNNGWPSEGTILLGTISNAPAGSGGQKTIDFEF